MEQDATGQSTCRLCNAPNPIRISINPSNLPPARRGAIQPSRTRVVHITCWRKSQLWVSRPGRMLDAQDGAAHFPRTIHIGMLASMSVSISMISVFVIRFELWIAFVAVSGSEQCHKYSSAFQQAVNCEAGASQGHSRF